MSARASFIYFISGFELPMVSLLLLLLVVVEWVGACTRRTRDAHVALAWRARDECTISPTRHDTPRLSSARLGDRWCVVGRRSAVGEWTAGRWRGGGEVGLCLCKKPVRRFFSSQEKSEAPEPLTQPRRRTGRAPY